MLRQTVKTDEIGRSVDACSQRYPNGVGTNMQKGDVPTRYQSVATSLAPYGLSPPISRQRIDRYEGQRVPSHERSHKTERVERATVDGSCMGRMVPHTFSKGRKRVRYDGASHGRVPRSRA
jgi:hypothetical protein